MNFALQNADNALREMAEFEVLLEVFKQRENFSANSFFNENNFKYSETLSKMLNYKANLSENSLNENLKSEDLLKRFLSEV